MSLPENRLGVELHSLLRFEAGGRLLAVSLEHVREVVDLPTLVPYPMPHAGHLGIVNVRGQIIPVVAARGPEGADVAELRLVVMEFRPGRPFAVRASRVQKVMHPADEVVPGRTITLGGRPCRLSSEEDFP